MYTVEKKLEQETFTGYKLVKKTEEGGFVSFYAGTSIKKGVIGKPRCNHYMSPEQIKEERSYGTVGISYRKELEGRVVVYKTLERALKEMKDSYRWSHAYTSNTEIIEVTILGDLRDGSSDMFGFGTDDRDVVSGTHILSFREIPKELPFRKPDNKTRLSNYFDPVSAVERLPKISKQKVGEPELI